MKKKNCLAMKVMAQCSFETSVTVHPTTQHNASDDCNQQQHRYEKLKYHADLIITWIPHNNLLYYST